MVEKEQSYPSRTLMTIFVVCVYAVYFPLSFYTASLEPYDLSLWIDRVTPLSINWIYIYAMVFLTGFVPIVVIRQPRIFYVAVKAFLLVEVMAYLSFVLFPVHVHRPLDIPIESFAAWGLRLCYFLDQPANCFPSLHVAMALLASLACWKVDRFVGLVTFVLALFISASTMLVKQHYFSDVLFGAFLAFGAYIIFLHKVELRADEHVDKAPGRKGALFILLIYLCVLLGLYLAYCSDWKPWE